MASPTLKVYNTLGEYVASCRYPEDAAAIVTSYGDGASIRFTHRKKWTLWTEGRESQPAGESYDFVAQTAYDRIEAIRKELQEERERRTGEVW